MYCFVYPDIFLLKEKFLDKLGDNCSYWFSSDFWPRSEPILTRCCWFIFAGCKSSISFVKAKHCRCKITCPYMKSDEKCFEIMARSSLSAFRLHFWHCFTSRLPKESNSNWNSLYLTYIILTISIRSIWFKIQRNVNNIVTSNMKTLARDENRRCKKCWRDLKTLEQSLYVFGECIFVRKCKEI